MSTQLHTGRPMLSSIKKGTETARTSVERLILGILPIRYDNVLLSSPRVQLMDAGSPRPISLVVSSTFRPPILQPGKRRLLRKSSAWCTSSSKGIPQRYGSLSRSTHSYEWMCPLCSKYWRVIYLRNLIPIHCILTTTARFPSLTARPPSVSRLECQRQVRENKIPKAF